jgi:hypothetical protein
MDELKCFCGESIPDEEIQFYTGNNELGEDFHAVDAKCKKCNQVYEASGWGEINSIDEAKETLKTEIKNLE